MLVDVWLPGKVITIWLLDSRINGAQEILGRHTDYGLGGVLQSYGGKVTEYLVRRGELPYTVLILNDLCGCVCVMWQKSRRHKHKSKENQRFFGKT